MKKDWHSTEYKLKDTANITYILTIHNIHKVVYLFAYYEDFPLNSLHDILVVDT